MEKARNRRDDQLLVGLKLSLWGRRALEHDILVRWEVQARLGVETRTACSCRVLLFFGNFSIQVKDVDMDE